MLRVGAVSSNFDHLRVTLWLWDVASAPPEPLSQMRKPSSAVCTTSKWLQLDEMEPTLVGNFASELNTFTTCKCDLERREAQCLKSLLRHLAAPVNFLNVTNSLCGFRMSLMPQPGSEPRNHCGSKFGSSSWLGGGMAAPL